jgi:hypothetical protein
MAVMLDRSSIGSVALAAGKPYREPEGRRLPTRKGRRRRICAINHSRNGWIKKQET